jgi:hypothetical protein
MGRQLFILSLFLLVSSVSAIGQSSQAKMRVSVNVVKGSSVEINQSEKISFDTQSKLNFGSLTLKGINKSNVLISSPDVLKLTDKDGHELFINVTSKRNTVSDSAEQIQYELTSQESPAQNMYKGQLTTTIEYL